MCRFALALACLIGCATDRSPTADTPVPILLAGEDGTPSVVGHYKHGVLELDAVFTSSFDLAGDLDLASGHVSLSIDRGDHQVAIDPDSRSAVIDQPLASGDTLSLAIAVGNDVVDEFLLVASDHTGLDKLAAFAQACSWQYSTVAYRGSCAEGAQRMTMEYWKRSTCSCAGCWQRYGGSTWCK